MPSRQGRLDTSYFSQSQQSGSSRNNSSNSRGQDTGSQRTKKSRAQRDESGDEQQGGDDSEGSEGLNNIRLSQSPSRRRRKEKNGEVVDLISEEEEDVAIQVEEAGKGGQVASTSRTSDLDLDIVVLDDDSQDEAKSDTPLIKTPVTLAPKRRLDLSSGMQPIFTHIPVPTNFTRLGTTNANKAASTSISRNPVPKGGRKPLIPYIELVAWSEENKAIYLNYLPTPGRPQVEQPDNLAAFLGDDMAVEMFNEIPVTNEILRSLPQPKVMPTVYEVIDLSDDEEEVWAPAKKRSRAVPVVEIPIRRSRTPQTGNGGHPERKQRALLDDGEDEDVPTKKGENEKSRASRLATTQAVSSRRKPSPSRSKDRRESVYETDGSESEQRKRSSKKDKGKGGASYQSDDASESEPEQPKRSSKKDKGKGRARYESDDVSESESDRTTHKHKSSKHDKKASKHTSDASRLKKIKRKEREPSFTRDDLLDEIGMDESARFKTKTRLREKKETPHQRMLRILKDKRAGIVKPDTPSESSDSEDDSEDETDTSDSATDSRGGTRRLRRSSSFIEDDGDVVQGTQLPPEFSSESVQTPEYKFKVVFQYFVLMAVHGTGILPLRGDQKDYFIPQLMALRRKMKGHADGRVRSQIWPANYVKALSSYSEAIVYHMDVPEEHCLACNRTNYKSTFRLEFQGAPYNPDTYEPLPNVDQKRKARAARLKEKKAKAKRRAEQRRRNSETPPSAVSDSDDDSDEETTNEEDDLIRPKDDIFLGPHCKKRSILFHQMVHWEWILWNRILTYYHHLLRAKNQAVQDDSDASPSEGESDLSDDTRSERQARRQMRRDHTRIRVKKLRGKRLPQDYKDTNSVQAWMDKEQYILTEFKWLEDLEDQSKRLEFDRNKDE